ncbi:MAG: hypothetical protein ACXWPV_10640 [Candidatus Limnocylindrales bacterium]
MQAILERYMPRLGPFAEADVIALGIVTVDHERAAADLPALVFRPAPDDELLGARVLAAPLPSGRRLLLLEPAREGRLTAFLARHGEGLAALYVAGAARGSAVLVPGEAADDPVIVLVTSPVVPAGTIRP